MRRHTKNRIFLILFSMAVIGMIVAVSNMAAVRPGEEIDNYKGIAVYYNGPDIDSNHGSNYSSDGYYFGEKWQCVEFARRFFYGVKGHEMPDILGNARDYFDPAVAPGKMNYRRGMIQYLNGGDMKPQIDDLLVFNNSTYGHLSIVTKVDNNYIEVVQQNANRQTRQILPLHCKGNKFEIGDPRPIGWLRYQKEL